MLQTAAGSSLLLAAVCEAWRWQYSAAVVEMHPAAAGHATGKLALQCRAATLCVCASFWAKPLTISPSCRVVPDELMSISIGSDWPCFSRYSSSATISSVTAGTSCSSGKKKGVTQMPMF